MPHGPREHSIGLGLRGLLLRSPPEAWNAQGGRPSPWENSMSRQRQRPRPQRPNLAPADQEHLQRLNKKFELVRDNTASVATGRTTGFYLYGVGGAGKSYTIINELERRKVPYKLFNSRMTGRGLYNTLEKFPDETHVLEDMEQLFRDSGARGVLRSALWGQRMARDKGPLERLVTWTTFRMEHSFVFTGGIIMTANRPFPDLPELDAIKTRITYMQLVVSDNEMIALMRSVSHKGFRDGLDEMDPAECSDVCEFIIAQCLGLRRLLDMRLLINSFKDYLQWRDCESGCDWRDMVSARVKDRPTVIGDVRSVEERTAERERELEVARQIVGRTDDRRERFRIWREQIGKSEQTLYRRLAELREG